MIMSCLFKIRKEIQYDQLRTEKNIRKDIKQEVYLMNQHIINTLISTSLPLHRVLYEHYFECNKSSLRRLFGNRFTASLLRCLSMLD